jgi:acyl carrier protein
VKDDTEKKIIKIVEQVTHDSGININSTDQNVDGWDSLAYLVIALKVEENFKIEITIQNIDKLNSIRNIIEIVNSNDEGANV